MKKIRKRIAAVVYIILSLIALLLWFAFIIGSSFAGGAQNPAAQNESAVVFGDVAGIMLLGLAGAVLGIVAGIRGLAVKSAGTALPVCAAALGAVGSVSFFLLDIGEIGILAFLISVIPTLLYLPLKGKREIKEHGSV